MKHQNNQKLTLQKKLVVKLNNNQMNNTAGGKNKLNADLATNPMEGIKAGDTSIIDSFFCIV
ncbi:MAG TPA: class I lanthipeptide [Pedobacter sp.]